MADQAETPLICGAAGDPCIAEITKPSCNDADVKNQDPEITSVPEVCVVNSKTSPSANKGILIEKTVDQDICSANEVQPQNTAESSAEPEVLVPKNGRDIQDPELMNLREEVESEAIRAFKESILPKRLQIEQKFMGLMLQSMKFPTKKKRTNERDNYEKKLADTEKKLAALEAAFEAATNGKDDQSNLRRELKELKNSLAQSQAKLNDRGRLMANQENQINALTKQVSSLKEVVAITKNLLEIRNMEVKHLQEDVDSMETRITAERDRHNAMLRKMEAAVRLNADLKTEYETQLRLFQDLRGKYEEKVTLLTGEDKTANGAAAVSEKNAAPPPTAQ